MPETGRTKLAWTCIICNMVSDRKQNMKKHILNKHKIPENDVEKNIKCDPKSAVTSGKPIIIVDKVISNEKINNIKMGDSDDQLDSDTIIDYCNAVDDMVCDISNHSSRLGRLETMVKILQNENDVLRGMVKLNNL